MSLAAYSLEVESLRRQVMDNCHRSDARYAGAFSLCGLLLRLREYYKWETGRPPWIEAEPQEVLAWIDARESLWETVQDQEMAPLSWRGREIDCFDGDQINQDLAEDGLFYGSGFAAFLKPSFFLGRVVGQRRLGNYKVVYLGEEIARDLFTVPAQTQENQIVARLGPLAAYLWDCILHAGASKQKALETALSAYGLSLAEVKGPNRTWTPKFRAMLNREIEPYVRHEYAEATDEVFPRSEWRALIAAHPHTRTELMARNIKDLLAETGEGGRLDFIIKQRRLGSLGFFAAQLDGLAARLFAELGPAFQVFLRDRDWAVIEAARQKARTRATTMAGQLVSMLQEDRRRTAEWLPEKVEEVFFRPLGL